jgi:hypothetical protein
MRASTNAKVVCSFLQGHSTRHTVGLLNLRAKNGFTALYSFGRVIALRRPGKDGAVMVSEARYPRAATNRHLKLLWRIANDHRLMLDNPLPLLDCVVEEVEQMAAKHFGVVGDRFPAFPERTHHGR